MLPQTTLIVTPTRGRWISTLSLVHRVSHTWHTTAECDTTATGSRVMVQLATTDAAAGLWMLILLVVALSSCAFILDDLIEVSVLTISATIVSIATVVIDVDILAA